MKALSTEGMRGQVKALSVWGRVNNWLFCIMLGTVAAFGLATTVSLAIKYGLAEVMNQVGYLMLVAILAAVALEAFRLVKNRTVGKKWWVSFLVAISLPLFILGVVSVAGWLFYGVIVVLASVVFQNLYHWVYVRRVDTDQKTL